MDFGSYSIFQFSPEGQAGSIWEPGVADTATCLGTAWRFGRMQIGSRNEPRP